jgi:hypothetical protein
MLVVAKDLQTQYEKALDSASISREPRPHFRKWLRFYLDFVPSTEIHSRLRRAMHVARSAIQSRTALNVTVICRPLNEIVTP